MVRDQKGEETRAVMMSKSVSSICLYHACKDRFDTALECILPGVLHDGWGFARTTPFLALASYSKLRAL